MRGTPSRTINKRSNDTAACNYLTNKAKILAREQIWATLLHGLPISPSSNEEKGCSMKKTVKHRMKLEKLSQADVIYVIALTIASLIAYVLTYYILEPFVTQPNDMLGGMWATIATVFVLKEARNQSLRIAGVRFFATCVSFVLTFVYLLLLPFSPAGMAVIIGLETIVMMLLGRREDVVTTAITTIVIMVAAGLGPASMAWTIPPLRLLDTVIGIVVGVGGWWIAETLRRFASADD
jgi:hypothetical protein